MCCLQISISTKCIYSDSEQEDRSCWQGEQMDLWLFALTVVCLLQFATIMKLIQTNPPRLSIKQNCTCIPIFYKRPLLYPKHGVPISPWEAIYVCKYIHTYLCSLRGYKRWERQQGRALISNSLQHKYIDKKGD